jgi:transcriptional regulator with XRE-family HTH domain
MATLNSIGRTLTRNTRLLLRKSDFNMSELERITGVSRRTLSRIEAARKARRPYNPMLKTVVKLATAAGVSVDTYLSTNS